MKTFVTSIGLALASCIVLPQAIVAAPPSQSEDEFIPYEQFTLDNGLRVVVHEDRKTPTVAVSVWYHAGSKDEPEGKTGFAHLFEHIMFKGSENFDGDFFKALSDIGGSGINGTTSNDRTNYFETVPTPGLERILWLESDRMGHLLGAVTQEVLDAERGVVQNEKRQREGAPMGDTFTRINAALFPKGHPYHHAVIGSMEDLDAASLEDTHEWFKQYYGASNALVVLSGDIDAAEARPLMEKYFSDVPPGPPLGRMKAQVPYKVENSFEVVHDRIAEPMLIRAWAVPGYATKESGALDAVAGVLGGGALSPLYKELVEKRKLAVSVSATVSSMELASLFYIRVLITPDADVAEVEAVIDEVVADFLVKPPAKKHLDYYVDSNITAWSYAQEHTGMKGRALAEGVLYANDPGHVGKTLAAMKTLEPRDVQAAAKKWLTRGFHQLTYLPFEEYKSSPSAIDRSVMPQASNDLTLDLPDVEEATLSNGMRVVFAPRRTAPVVNMVLHLEGSGPFNASRSDLASVVSRTMGWGPANLSFEEFSYRQSELGMQAFMASEEDYSAAMATALKGKLAESVALWADSVRLPAFRQSDFESTRDIFLDMLRQTKVNQRRIASTAIEAALYGETHPNFPHNVWGEGAEAYLKNLTVDDVKAFYDKHYSPEGAVFYIVGDTSLAEITALLEKEFGNWKAKSAQPAALVTTPDIPAPDRARVILIDFPDTPQATIRLGRLVQPIGTEEDWALNAVNYAFGGSSVSSRLGSNLRAEKGWSYGAASRVGGQELGQRAWGAIAMVQTDKTAQSMTEIIKELKAITSDRPVTRSELDIFVNREVLTLPAEFELGRNLATNIWENARLGRPLDFEEGIPAELSALTLDEVNAKGREVFQLQSMTWVVVGDLSKIEEDIRDLNIGDVEVWDTDGKRVR